MANRNDAHLLEGCVPGVHTGPRERDQPSSTGRAGTPCSQPGTRTACCSTSTPCRSRRTKSFENFDTGNGKINRKMNLYSDGRRWETRAEKGKRTVIGDGPKAGAYPGGMHRMHVHPPSHPVHPPPRPCASPPLPSLKGWL